MGINITTLQITPEILSLISEIDEFKGTWKVLAHVAPGKFSALKKVATIESIGSSTRIEGSRLSDAQVEALLSNLSLQSFASRDGQEVAGYAGVMDLVFQNHQHIELTENNIRQLHQNLLEYSEKDQHHRGNYKTFPNHIETFDATGKSLGIVFETATPFDTPFQMETLISWTRQAFELGELHPLLITAAFVVAFLAIHPFQDGNGRLSRILTTWLLLRSGYTYVPYSSLEAVIEHNKEGYYVALRKTQQTFTTPAPEWQSWIVFFLKALKEQKQQLERKIETEKLLTVLPALSVSIIDSTRSRGRITISDIVTLTNANRNTIKKHLESLVATNQLKKHGIGKGSFYTL